MHSCRKGPFRMLPCAISERYKIIELVGKEKKQM
jgi:hypothetical protein